MRDFDFLISIAFFDLIFFRESKAVKSKAAETKAAETEIAETEAAETKVVETETAETACAGAGTETTCASAAVITAAEACGREILVDGPEAPKTACESCSL